MSTTCRIRSIRMDDGPALELYADLLRRHLYAEGQDPMAQITKAEVIFAIRPPAVHRDVGFSSVNRLASPDEIDNDGSVQWLEDTVVDIPWQGLGYGLLLQERRLSYALSHPGRICTSAIDQRRDAALLRSGWQLLRHTIEMTAKGGRPCRVYELPRSIVR